MLTYVIRIYPNTRLSTLSNHYQLVIMGPVSVSASRWHVYRLTSPDTTVSNEDLASLKKEIAFVKDTGVEEDREAACSMQKGLLGDGNSYFTFGRFEKAIVHFNRQLNAHVNELSS